MTTHPFILYLRQVVVEPIAKVASTFMVEDVRAITYEPIDVAAMLERAHHPMAGGIVLFSGEVRDHHVGKEVSHLEYEAHVSLAGKSILHIVQSAKQRWNLHYAAAVHRIGRLEISESAVVVVTSHAHRKEAYEANQYIIGRIKHEAPIWKCEHYTDGSYEWGKNC